MVRYKISADQQSGTLYLNSEEKSQEISEKLDEPDIPLIRYSYPVIAQAIVGFAFGIMLSPWSIGIEFVILFFIVYELLIFAITEGKPPLWRWQDRVFVVSCYLLGWILGRALAGWRDPFSDTPFVQRLRTVETSN